MFKYKMLILLSIGIICCIFLFYINKVNNYNNLNEQYNILFKNKEKLNKKYIELFNNYKNINKKYIKLNYNIINNKHITLKKEKEIVIKYIINQNNKCDIKIAKLITESLFKQCKKYDVNPWIILSMMNVESTFNPFAISKDGARGLMQVMPNINKNKFNPIKLHEIEYGIEAGIIVLNEKLNIHNNLLLSIKRYNGVGKEAKNFIHEVLKTLGLFITFRYEQINNI